MQWCIVALNNNSEKAWIIIKTSIHFSQVKINLYCYSFKKTTNYFKTVKEQKN